MWFRSKPRGCLSLYRLLELHVPHPFLSLNSELVSSTLPEIENRNELTSEFHFKVKQELLQKNDTLQERKNSNKWIYIKWMDIKLMIK